MPTLTNWNEEISFSVSDANFRVPKDISDVQAIVMEASNASKAVTVVGALHSTTECMVGSGIIISMKNMDKVVSMDEREPDRPIVTVQAGVSLRQLCSYLKPRNLQPPVVLEFGNFQIGAISGTHANDTSITRSAQFSSFVIGVKLVTPTGRIMDVSEEKNKQYLPAMRSHFGLFGVVCEVTLRVFRSQPLHVSVQTAEVAAFLKDFDMSLKALKEPYDQVFGMLFPNSGKIFWQCRKFDEHAKPGITDLAQSKSTSLFKDILLPLVKAGTTVQSSAAIAGILSAMVIELPLGIFSHGSYVMDPSDRGITYTDNDPSFEFYDWVFPEQNWSDMIKAFLQLTDRFRREHDFSMALPTLIYFIGKDDASLLSRSRQGNMIAIDPTYPDPKDPKWKEFRLQFNKIALQHNGIPHINKTRDGALSHFANALQDPDAIKLYHQKRNELDPKDLFLNDYFKEMFKNYL
jgi:L-gulonolactone oxidase